MRSVGRSTTIWKWILFNFSLLRVICCTYTQSDSCNEILIVSSAYAARFSCFFLFLLNITNVDWISCETNTSRARREKHFRHFFFCFFFSIMSARVFYWQKVEFEPKNWRKKKEINKWKKKLIKKFIVFGVSYICGIAYSYGNHTYNCTSSKLRRRKKRVKNNCSRVRLKRSHHLMRARKRERDKILGLSTIVHVHRTIFHTNKL